MDSPTRVTVILCTYNRAQSLATALESVAASEFSDSTKWDVLIVDNNSSDQTPEVAEDFCRRYPGRFRYLFVPQQGKSHALNAAILEAPGGILAFIDDDETVDAGWLQNLTANLHSGEWAGAGGRVLPPLSFSRPGWMSSTSSFTSGPLAIFDLGQEAGQLTEPPFGANMAFRKEVFERYGGFRVDLGRTGKSMISNEDTELGRRLFAAGQRLRYEPSALTYHPVEEFRLRREYFLTWWFNKGRSDVRELGNQFSRTRFLGIPLRLFRNFAIQSVRWMIAIEPSHRFVCKLKVWACAGQAFEFFQQRLDAKRKGPDRNSELRRSAEGRG